MDCLFKLIEDSNTEKYKKKVKNHKQEKSFLASLCKFMGGLGNALQFTFVKLS